jgi:predicted ATPase
MLLDQPEAQLHPRLQSAVADLLTEVVQGGRRLLIETASEPFVRRWLHQVRTGKLLAADLGIFFVHKLDGVSRFTEVEVESDGTLPNGPPGFWSDE